MKRMMLAGAVAGMLFGAASFSSGRALAQEAPAPNAAAGGDNVSYKQKTVYDFDDDVVEGDLVRPDGEFVDSRAKTKHNSLIKVRENFIPEMLKAAEDL